MQESTQTNLGLGLIFLMIGSVFAISKFVIAPKKDKVLKKAAEELGLNFKKGLFGAGKVFGEYQGLNVKIVTSAGEHDRRQFMGSIRKTLKSLKKKAVWTKGSISQTKVEVELPEKKDTQIIDDNIFVKSNKLSFYFPRKKALSLFVFESVEELVTAVKTSVQKTKELL